MSDPTVKQQNAAAVRRAERLANPDPDYAASVAEKCFETDIEIWAASRKPRGDRMNDTDITRECAELRAAVRELTTQLATAERQNAELDQRLRAAEQQRANYSPPSCDRLRDDL